MTNFDTSSTNTTLADKTERNMNDITELKTNFKHLEKSVDDLKDELKGFRQKFTDIDKAVIRASWGILIAILVPIILHFCFTENKSPTTTTPQIIKPSITIVMPDNQNTKPTPSPHP